MIEMFRHRAGTKEEFFVNRKQKSAPQRQLWAQFDALQMGSGWDMEDVQKPQILLEDVYGDSHPGSVHLAGLMEQAKYGVLETGASTTPRTSVTDAPRAMTG